MFSNIPWQLKITRALILITPLVWIAWDFYAFYSAGNVSTESATIFRYSTEAPGIGVLVGILIGHLFFQMHQPTAFPPKEK